MFNPQHLKKKSSLEVTIDKLHAELETIDPSTEQFASAADNLAKLYKMRENDRSALQVSGDTLLIVAANLLGIGLIVRHEREHVITTKAMTFVKKLF